MPYDLSKPLVIGISSRALFNLEQENKIFEEQGVEAYEAYQVAHENEILQKGAAFQLIKAFLELNNTELGRLVEVIIMSRNNANTCLRIFNSFCFCIDLYWFCLILIHNHKLMQIITIININNFKICILLAFVYIIFSCNVLSYIL